VLGFQVLGRLRVVDGDAPVALPQGKLSVLLAGLLLRVNQVVSAEQLVDWLWGADQPADPRRALNVCVARLRQVLGEAGSAVIVTHSGGYCAAGSADTVDLLRVRELLEKAKAARGGDPAVESACLAAALAQWEHPILREIPSDAMHRDETSRIDAEWTYVVERRVDVDLALGRHTELLVELAGLVAAFPLRERFCAQLMTALYRSGRQAEALVEYERLRLRLAEELGADPAPELRELRQQILDADPALDIPAAGGVPAAPPAPAAPAQLPADLASFIGRVAELDTLGELPDAEGAAARVAVIDGMAGIGKTALAVHVAYRLAGQFPDGQLFLDLHGFTLGVTAVQPADALDRMLRSLGVPGGQIPAHLDDRAALFRGRLAATRTLIVLDNAATEAQVRPLLPAASGCLVLVTSRRRLTGLDDAHTVSLDLLPPADAAALFARAAGADRLAGEPAGAVAEVVDLCGRLPLAVRIAAARLRSRPAWTVGHLVQRLRAHRHRLDELDAGQRSVTAALDLSYRHLTGEQRRLYQLLGLHPGTEFDGHAAAALADVAPAPAGRLLDELLDIHLLAEPSPGRYRFHDLTRAHAVATAGTVPAADRQAALTRLLDHYADTASAAMDLVYPYEADQRPHRPRSGTAVLALDTPAQAEAWLDTELDNLLAAAAGGWRRHTLHQAATLHRHLRTRACYGRAEALHEHAVCAGRAVGDRCGELTALTNLGDVHRLRSRYGRAAECYRQALETARDIGHRGGELLALAGLGWVDAIQYRHEPATDNYLRALGIARETGHRSGELDVLIGLGNTHIMVNEYGPAADWFVQALEAARRIGHRIGEQSALVGLGWVDATQGRYVPAADRYRHALGIARELGNPGGEAHALTGLGHVHRAMADFGAAAECYGRVLVIAREIGDRTGELAALAGLGQVDRARGRHGPAADWYEQALDLARAAGDRNWQFEALHGMGHLCHAAGQPEAALHRHQQALELACDLNHPADQARAHDGLAHAHRALGQYEQAREHWLRTVDILTVLSTDHTFDEQVTAATVRTQLADLDRGPDRPASSADPADPVVIERASTGPAAPA
jgi:DNA-binding SARP family transcriptional activator